MSAAFRANSDITAPTLAVPTPVLRVPGSLVSDMLRYWTPRHDETTWTMRTRTQRKNNSTLVADTGLIDYVQRRAEAET